MSPIYYATGGRLTFRPACACPDMDDDRKKPGWKFWTPVIAIVLVTYSLSYGPFMWSLSQYEYPVWALWASGKFYWPMHYLFVDGPGPIRAVLEWYVNFWIL